MSGGLKPKDFVAEHQFAATIPKRPDSERETLRLNNQICTALGASVGTYASADEPGLQTGKYGCSP